MVTAMILYFIVFFGTLLKKPLPKLDGLDGAPQPRGEVQSREA